MAVNKKLFYRLISCALVLLTITTLALGEEPDPSESMLDGLERSLEMGRHERRHGHATS